MDAAKRYEYTKTLGEGHVWLCRDREKGSLVAVKKFKDANKDTQAYQLAMREIKLLRSAQHEYVVGVVEAFRSQSSGNVYLVMEYAETCLSAELKAARHGFEPERARSVAWQLVQALGYLHSRKVMHRDLKPANILLTEAGVVKLCDFGFARDATHSSAAELSQYVTTRWYRAPEVIVGGDYGTAVDVWAFGCVFGELLTGVPLFPGSNNLDQLSIIFALFGFLPTRLMTKALTNPSFAGSKLVGTGRKDYSLAIRERYAGCSEAEQAVLIACLNPDPVQRATADELLRMPYFDALRGSQASTPRAGLGRSATDHGNGLLPHHNGAGPASAAEVGSDRHMHASRRPSGGNVLSGHLSLHRNSQLYMPSTTQLGRAEEDVHDTGSMHAQMHMQLHKRGGESRLGSSEDDDSASGGTSRTGSASGSRRQSHQQMPMPMLAPWRSAPTTFVAGEVKLPMLTPSSHGKEFAAFAIGGGPDSILSRTHSRTNSSTSSVSGMGFLLGAEGSKSRLYGGTSVADVLQLHKLPSQGARASISSILDATTSIVIDADTSLLPAANSHGPGLYPTPPAPHRTGQGQAPVAGSQAGGTASFTDNCLVGVPRGRLADNAVPDMMAQLNSINLGMGDSHMHEHPHQQQQQHASVEATHGGARIHKTKSEGPSMYKALLRNATTNARRSAVVELPGGHGHPPHAVQQKGSTPERAHTHGLVHQGSMAGSASCSPFSDRCSSLGLVAAAPHGRHQAHSHETVGTHHQCPLLTMQSHNGMERGGSEGGAGGGLHAASGGRLVTLPGLLHHGLSQPHAAAAAAMSSQSQPGLHTRHSFTHLNASVSERVHAVGTGLAQGHRDLPSVSVGVGASSVGASAAVRGRMRASFTSVDAAPAAPAVPSRHKT